MPVTPAKPGKRPTREETRAQTRATLVAVGRAHFLHHGLGGAVAEKIAADAGYSRGALYSNFDGKEELFLAVISEEQAHSLDIFRSILNQRLSSKVRLRKMRDAFGDLVTDRDWIMLHAEFEAEALRSERIRNSFVEFHRKTVRDGEELIRELMRSSKLILRLSPGNLVTTMMAFSHGLATIQRILGAGLSRKTVRTLIQSLFDYLISAA